MIRRFPTLFCLSAVCLIVLATMAAPAVAQSFSFDMGDAGGSFTGRIIQLLVLMTVLTLAPSILVVVTSFTRIVVVLSIIRSALGLQQTPPNAVLISLALFLTAFIMAPTFETAYLNGIEPLINEEIDEEEAFKRTIAPIHEFMMEHVREKDLALFLNIADAPPPESAAEPPGEVPMSPNASLSWSGSASVITAANRAHASSRSDGHVRYSTRNIHIFLFLIKFF